MKKYFSLIIVFILTVSHAFGQTKQSNKFDFWTISSSDPKIQDLETKRDILEGNKVLETKKFFKNSHYYIVATILDSLNKPSDQCIAVDRIRSGCIVDYKKITINEVRADTVLLTSMDKKGTTIQETFVNKKLVKTEKLKHHEAITIMVLRFEK